MALADERFVAMPAIGGDFEGNHRAQRRRNLFDVIVDVVAIVQNTQASVLRPAGFVEVQQHRDQFGRRVGMDDAIGKLGLTAHIDHNVAIREIDLKLLRDQSAKPVTAKFIEQRAEWRTISRFQDIDRPWAIDTGEGRSSLFGRARRHRVVSNEIRVRRPTNRGLSDLIPVKHARILVLIEDAANRRSLRWEEAHGLTRCLCHKLRHRPLIAIQRRIPMKHWFKDQHFRSLLKNTSYLAVSKGVAATASIATLAMTGRSLGLEMFGLLILIASYAQAASGIVKFQSWQLVIRYGGPALVSGDEVTFKHVVGFAVGLDLISGVVGLAAATLVLPMISGWFGLPDDYLKLALLYCLLIPTMGAAGATGVLRALDRFDLISWQGTATPIARVMLVSFAFWLDWSFAAFVAIWFVTDLAGDMLLWFLALRELRRRDLLDNIRLTLRPNLPNAWPFAMKVNFTQSLAVAWGPVARLIVGGLLGPTSAAIYRVAASLAESARKPADMMAKVYYPEVVRMDLATKKPWRLMVRGTALAGLVGLVAVLLLVVGGRPLIGALFGAQFLGVYPVLMIMVGVPLLAMLSFPLAPMLYALDRPGAPLKARIVGTALYFAIVAPLSWRFDVRGAAIALVVGHAAMVVILLWQLRREHRRVRAS